jgi:hypothetical protein
LVIGKDDAHAIVEALHKLIAKWEQLNTSEQVSTFFGQDAPQPDPVLRVTPRI